MHFPHRISMTNMAFECLPAIPILLTLSCLPHLPTRGKCDRTLCLFVCVRECVCVCSSAGVCVRAGVSVCECKCQCVRMGMFVCVCVCVLMCL